MDHHRPLYVNCTQDTIYCQRMRHRHLPCGLSASVTLSARDIPQTAVLIINLPLPRPGSLACNKQRRKFLFRSTATTALNSAILKLMCRGETISGRHVFASYFWIFLFCRTICFVEIADGLCNQVTTFCQFTLFDLFLSTQRVFRLGIVWDYV